MNPTNLQTQNAFIRKNHAYFFEARDFPVGVVSGAPAGELVDVREDELRDQLELHAIESGFPAEAAVQESVSADFSGVRSALQPGTAGENEVVNDDFSSYIIPIVSTDYAGIEKLDPRLADRIWRLNNLYWVINEDGELIKFKMRPAQEYLLKNLHYKNIILKARQLGFTTFICLFMLDYAVFNKTKQLGIVAHTQNDATIIFRKVKTAWDNFPQAIKEYFKLDTIGDSAAEYQFTNGSVFRISTSLRSGTYQAVLITEFGKICAHWPEKSVEIVTGTLPAVPSKGLVFIESTAEGEDGYYYEFCQDAMEADRMKRPLTVKDYKFFFFPWYQNPANVVQGQNLPITPEVNEYLDKMQSIVKIEFTEAQRNWYYLEKKVQRAKMQQEHPTTADEAFLVSGNKLFPGPIIDAQREKYCVEPIEIQGDFLFYKRYVKSHLYGLGADVSQGMKRDSSTIVVIDFTVGEVVMTYRSNTVDPVTFAHDIKKAAVWYGACIAAPEANNVGMTTCVTLNSIYPYVYTQVREGLTDTSPSNKLGYLSSGLTKPKYMYELGEAMESDELKCPDLGILLEAKKFNKEDALTVLPTEKTTRHFDLLIAAAIAWQMRAYMSRGKADPQDEAEVEQRRERVRSTGRKAYR